MGLPSGTLWADRNVGAISERDVGLLFQWANTKGYSTKDATNVKQADDKYYDGASYTKYTRWTENPNNKALLDLEDDAAYVNMGSQWRMPTTEEAQELIDNTTCSLEMKNNVWVGTWVTSKINNNTIFFPAKHGSNGYLLSDKIITSALDYNCTIMGIDYAKLYIGDLSFRCYTQYVRGIIR